MFRVFHKKKTFYITYLICFGVVPAHKTFDPEIVFLSKKEDARRRDGSSFL